MPELKAISNVLEDAQLLSLFKTGIRQKVWAILADQQSAAPSVAWAKKARTTFKDDRSDFYASLAIEGLLAASAEFRLAIDAAIQAPGNIDVEDEVFMVFVTLAVDLFISRDI